MSFIIGAFIVIAVAILVGAASGFGRANEAPRTPAKVITGSPLRLRGSHAACMQCGEQLTTYNEASPGLCLQCDHGPYDFAMVESRISSVSGQRRGKFPE